MASYAAATAKSSRCAMRYDMVDCLCHRCYGYIRAATGCARRMFYARTRILASVSAVKMSPIREE